MTRSNTQPADPTADADAQLTAERDEVKYRVAPAQVQALASALTHQLPAPPLHRPGSQRPAPPASLRDHGVFRHAVAASVPGLAGRRRPQPEDAGQGVLRPAPVAGRAGHRRPADRALQAGAVAGAEVQGRQPHRQAAHRHPQAAGARLLPQRDGHARDDRAAAVLLRRRERGGADGDRRLLRGATTSRCRPTAWSTTAGCPGRTPTASCG